MHVANPYPHGLLCSLGVCTMCELKISLVQGLQAQMNYSLTNEDKIWAYGDAVHAAFPFVSSFTAYCFHMLSFINIKWPLSFKDVMKLAYIGTPWTLENKLEARFHHVLLLHYIYYTTYELHNPFLTSLSLCLYNILG